MKRLFATLIFCLLLMLTATAAYANSFDESHLSPWDIELQQQIEANQPLPLDEASKKFNENKEIADHQKTIADQKALEKIIQGARTSVKNSPEFKSKKNIGSVTTASVVKTWWSWANRTNSDGGSGVGWSDATWAAADDIRNGSRAEMYGDYWAKAWGWDYYTPSTTGNYSVFTDFYATGRIITGSTLDVRVKVTDTNTGQSVTRNIFSPSPGYLDNQYVSATEQFYLTAGHNYSFTFETETNSSALASATFSDFFEQEFGGIQRKIYFYSMKISI